MFERFFSGRPPAVAMTASALAEEAWQTLTIDDPVSLTPPKPQQRPSRPTEQVCSRRCPIQPMTTLGLPDHLKPA